MKNTKESKEELNKLKEVCLKKADELANKYPDKSFSSWEIISMVLSESSGDDVYILTLKADLDVLKLIAEGLSASSIANRLSIPSQHVYAVANTWGMNVLDSSLDFNPIYVYSKDSTEQVMLSNINEILSIPITLRDVRYIINNIERYNDFIDFLEEHENEEN